MLSRMSKEGNAQTDRQTDRPRSPAPTFVQNAPGFAVFSNHTAPHSGDKQGFFGSGRVGCLYLYLHRITDKHGQHESVW